MPAIFCFIILCFVPADFAAQERSNFSPEIAQATISNNGIIITERVSEEDVQRIEDLNEDSALEYAQTVEEISEEDVVADTSEFDLMFDDTGDTESAITTETTETVKVDPKNKPITFSGSLSAELGGYVWFFPWEKTKPLATFTNTLKFVGRPSTDFFVVGSFRTSFPEMTTDKGKFLGIYELYFNYTLLGRVDISAGKRDVSWSLSRMLDTNILDDESGLITNPEDIFNPRERTADDSKFFVTVNIPIFSYGSIQGVSYYYPFSDISSISSDDLAMAGKIEGSVGKFSLAFFGMRWPTNDKNRFNPALGMEIVSTLLGKDSNMFMQGMIHFDSNSDKNFNRARFTTGVYKYFPNPVMLGLAFEYQIIWDENEAAHGTGKRFQQFFASQVAWSHFIFDKKWTFGVEWFHDKGKDYGTILPVVKIENIVKYTDLRFAFPIYYGTEKKYGMVFEAILKLDY